MSSPIESSPQWQPDAVLQRLEDKASGGHPVSAQVFMSEAVDPGDLARRAHDIAREAAFGSGVSPEAVRVTKVFPLARCFSLHVDTPDILRAIASSRDVKSILESEQSDILPRPLNRRPAR